MRADAFWRDAVVSSPPWTARSAKDEVLALAIQRPELGSVRAARELKARSVRLSPSGVREIWERHGLARATSG